MKKVGASSATSYALIDEDDMPDKYSVIFYYLDSNNRLGINREIDSDDADEIESLTSTKIKVGKNQVMKKKMTKKVKIEILKVDIVKIVDIVNIVKLLNIVQVEIQNLIKVVEVIQKINKQKILII